MQITALISKGLQPITVFDNYDIMAQKILTSHYQEHVQNKEIFIQHS